MQCSHRGEWILADAEFSVPRSKFTTIVVLVLAAAAICAARMVAKLLSGRHLSQTCSDETTSLSCAC